MASLASFPKELLDASDDEDPTYELLNLITKTNETNDAIVKSAVEKLLKKVNKLV
jgi:hypothetical protein